jgi:ATP-dependent RNA helicase DDX51/DBP6
MTATAPTTVEVSRITKLIYRTDFHSTTSIPKAKNRHLMAKKTRTKQSEDVAVRSAVPATSEHDGEKEDMDCDGDERMLDSGDEHEVVLDLDDAKGVQAEHEKTAKQLRKKKRHRKKGEGDGLDPAEDGDFERPRKRHKLRSSDARSPGRSRSTAADSSSSPVPSSPPGSSSPEEPAVPQSGLDHHRPRTPTPPLSPLQRFPLPSRPHAPKKAELASQGLDRGLASAQLVDPLLSTPLSLDEDGNDITGLSAKTLKRLRDLGIVELFAGVYRVALRKLQFSKIYNS